MSSPSKPETPKHEKLQAAHASKTFSEGTKVRANMGDSYMADMRKNSTGLKESRGSAQNAYGSKQGLVARRRAGSTNNVSTDGNMQQVASSIGQATGGGKNYSSARNTISNGVYSAARTGGIMSQLGHNKSMTDFQRSNEKKQAGMDIAVAAGQAYMYSDKSGTAKKSTPEASAAQDIFSQHDTTQMSVVQPWTPGGQ